MDLRLILLITAITTTFSANILVINPTIGQSHVNFLGNLADILTKDGHNVTILLLEIDGSLKSFGCKEKNITKIYFLSPYLNKNAYDDFEFKTDSIWKGPMPEGQHIQWHLWAIMMGNFHATFKGILEDQALIEKLRNSHFDIGILETFELGGVGLMHLFNVKNLMVTSAFGTIEYNRDSIGLPALPSFVPGWATTYTDKMSFWERLENFKFFFNIRYMYWYFDRISEKLFNEYDQSFPALHEILTNKTGVILSNTNEFTETARPITHLVQYIGGSNVYPPKKLDKTFDDLLNLRKCTVLMSFGTITKSCTMPNEMKQAFVNAFSQFPNYTFIWKYEDCEEDNFSFERYDNIVRVPWFPQSDLLADGRVSLFITHGGMNSMTEVGFRGKPILVMPFFGDQILNAKTTVSRGVGHLLDKSKITADYLKDLISEVLFNDVYSNNAKMYADLLAGKEDEYRQAICKWAGKIARYGRLQHLVLEAGNLNLVQLYSLDVISYLIVVYVGSTVMLLYVFKKLLRFYSRSMEAKQKTS